MKGGKIIRTINGESVKTAKKSLTFTATHGNLTFNSATKVVMIGRQGGVKYLNDYKPPQPLRVMKVEGPFDENKEKVAVVEKGKTYTYRVTQFNRELRTGIELKGLKWAIQNNEGNLIPAAQVTGKKEVSLSISKTEAAEKITIYAYFQKPIQKASAEASLKTGGINTRFYDEQGQQVYEIPAKLHKAFNEEYGIKIAYDKESEMLYYEEDCTPAYEKTSPTAIEHWKRELNPKQISKGKFIFGYNIGFKIVAEPSNNNWSGYNDYSLEDFDNKGDVLYLKEEKGSVEAGKVPGTPKANIQGWDEKEKRRRKKDKPPTFINIGDIAYIDLADFDDELNQIGWTYVYSYENKYKLCNINPPKFDRYFNLPRILEHEFIGHVIIKLTDIKYSFSDVEYKTEGPVPVEAKLCNTIRREIGIPDRITYTAVNEDGISIYFGYLNGSDEPDPNIKPIILERPEGGYTTISPPPKYPENHGRFELSKKNVGKLSTVKYYKTIKYYVYKKIFDFN